MNMNKRFYIQQGSRQQSSNSPGVFTLLDKHYTQQDFTQKYISHPEELFISLPRTNFPSVCLWSRADGD